MNYLQHNPSLPPSGSSSSSTSNARPSNSNSTSRNNHDAQSRNNLWKTPERKPTVAGGSRKMTNTRPERLDLMDVDPAELDEFDQMDEERAQGDENDVGQGMNMTSRIAPTMNSTSASTSTSMPPGREFQSYSGLPSSVPVFSSQGSGLNSMPTSSLPSSLGAQASSSIAASIPWNRSTHLRGPSRSHIPPIPIYNNDPTGGRAMVPLPASTGGTINTTLNPNGTVTTVIQGQGGLGGSHQHMTSHTGKGPLTPTSDKSFDQTLPHEHDRDSGSGSASSRPPRGASGAAATTALDLKTLMSPPTPAPSPTPGRNGWWGTVARDGSEGGVPGSTSGSGDISGFDPAQLLIAFPSLPPPTRLRLLNDLLPLLSTPELLMLNANIGPRLKRDFLRELPIELGLHVLSFIDDPTTLARASLVSKHWYRLLQDEKTWKGMCERHRFQTAEILPAIPVLTPTRNVPNAALVAGTVSAIPSSTNRLTPQFGITNPTMFSASRVGRNTGIMQASNDDEEEQEEEEDEDEHDYDENEDEYEEEETRMPIENGHVDYGQPIAQALRSTYTNYAPQPLSYPAAESHMPRRSQPEQHQAREQVMPGAYHITSTPSIPFNNIDPASYTGQTNGQLPPMPSIVSPSAVTSSSMQGQQFHMGLGLNQTDARAAAAANTISPFDSASYINRPLSVDHRDIYTTNREDRIGMVASSSSQSGFGRSASVPEPILMQNRRNPSYGTKKPEDVATEAPGFSYKNHFKKAYLTESNWLRGGRLLSTHTSTDEGVVTTLAMNTDYIVIGMANTKIHLFEAERGKFIRTFAGHELGVWALYLVSNGPPPSDGIYNDEIGMDGELNFNMGSYDNDPDSSGRAKARKRSRGDTRRASLGESSYRGGLPSHQANGSSSQSTQSGLRTQPGSYDPNGPFGPRYPGVEIYGSRWQTSDPANAAHGWGQKQQFIVSGGCDRDVKVWDLETGECLHTMHGHTSTIRCLKVLDGRPVAVTGARDASIRVWDIERGVSLHHLAGHTHSVRCIEIAGHYCVSGSYDCTARVWNLETGECLHVLRGHYHQIYDVAFDGEKVATGSLDSTVRIWSAATGECVALLQGHTSLVGQLKLSGDILVTGGSDGRVIIFDLSTYTCLQRICAHDNSVTSLQFDDRFILTGGNDGRVKLWDIKTGNFIRELSKPSEAVWRVTFKNDKCAVLCKRAGKTVLELLSFVPEEFAIQA